MSPSSTYASEQLIEVQRVDGLKKEGSYIVRLKDGVDKAQHLRWLSTRLGAASTITHDYPAAFANAYAGTFGEAALDALRRSPDVARIAEDAIGELFVTTVQEDAPWGLHRISRRPKLPFKYTYDAAAMGKGVDIYIIGENPGAVRMRSVLIGEVPSDTGIDLAHEEFAGRVSWGWAAPGLPHLDDKGHGTQVAGFAAGTTYGCLAREDATWALNRISQRPKLPFRYTYNTTATGKGVDIYIIGETALTCEVLADTGINVNHVDFAGRARWGWVAPDLLQEDDRGHCTQVAGVAAGTQYGVAKEADLVAVKTRDVNEYVHMNFAYDGWRG
ncbi:hypothetical protein BD413DRAFT_490999 [Trametes elegans]|nr:hypothetical protein BD413DRAFT_490999 [Trametes elegans]